MKLTKFVFQKLLVEQREKDEMNGSSNGAPTGTGTGIAAKLDSIDLFSELENLEEENTSLAEANRKLRDEKRDLMVKLSQIVCTSEYITGFTFLKRVTKTSYILWQWKLNL